MSKIKELLLVDDDRLFNHLHRLYLEEVNVAEKLIVEEDIEVCLKNLVEKKYSPEIIFLDINLPKMNGWEFLEEYKKHFNPKDRMIIMLSASSNPEDKFRAAAHPYVHSYYDKPLNEHATQKFIQMVKETLPLYANARSDNKMF